MESRSDGSEIHRLKLMRENYDNKLFVRLYKLVRPVIKNLVSGIDARRYNVSPDILRDQFYDKMLYVFNKYYGEISEEHLKASILRALSTYKNHLLKYAYNDRAEFNQSLRSLEDLFDDDKEFIDESEHQIKEEMVRTLNSYMRDKLSSDAFLVWECLVTPPPYIEIYSQFGKITNTLLAEFFNLPKTRSSVKYIGELREDIKYWLDRARKDLVMPVL